ncbi:MAG: hypothetical protein SF052_24080 [Bacteroidia bacterium]|nr:hypothetical protein [Bacteroidia bacterium]
MRTIQLFTSILSLFLSGLSAYSQTPARNVILLHGFGNGSNGWQVYENMFEQEWNINSYRFNYDNLNGVQNAADDVLQSLQTLTVPTGSNNIMMGHSTGGLAIRMMEHHPNPAQKAIMNSYFGGYITVGSPHKGIKLVNSYQNGNLEAFFDDGCKEVITDPLFSIFNSIFYGPISPAGLFIQNLGGGIVCNLAYERLKDSLSLYLAPNTLEDLKVGSPTLVNLPYTSSKPRIFLYGDEQSPVHWRFLSSLIDSMPVNIPPPPAPYAAGDEGYVNAANQIEAIETAVAGLAMTIGVINSLQGNFITGASSFYVAFQFAQGAAWLNNSEMGWNTLIGANDVYPFTITTNSMFICWSQIEDIERDYLDGVIDFPTYWQNLNATYQNPACWASQTYTMLITNNQISDGLAPQVTTRPDPLNGCFLDIADANHQEEVHHPNATARYGQIFDRDQEILTSCGPFAADFFKIN